MQASRLCPNLTG